MRYAGKITMDRCAALACRETPEITIRSRPEIAAEFRLCDGHWGVMCDEAQETCERISRLGREA